MKTYTATMPWGERFSIRADLAQASANIQIQDADGDWRPTPYQTADARHRAHDAVMLAVEYCGRDYYAEPDDERDNDEILAEISKSIEVECDDSDDESGEAGHNSNPGDHRRSGIEIRRIDRERGQAGRHVAYLRGREIATVWLSGPVSGTWYATVRFRNQEKDLDAKTREAALDAAADWLARAPELGGYATNANAEREITVSVKRDGHEYQATLDRATDSVSVYQDGVWAGEGRWQREQIDLCAAHLGDTEEQSERAYEALDVALSEALPGGYATNARAERTGHFRIEKDGRFVGGEFPTHSAANAWARQHIGGFWVVKETDRYGNPPGSPESEGNRAPQLNRDAIQNALAYVHHWERERGRAVAAREAIRATGLNDSEIDILLNALHVSRAELGTLPRQLRNPETKHYDSFKGMQVREGGDEHAAKELVLYIENDAKLFDSNSQAQSIRKNLLRKMKKGDYDSQRAEQAWMYLMEAGAKAYAKEFGEAREWATMFNKATRELAAAYFAADFETEAKLGNFDHILTRNGLTAADARKHNAAFPYTAAPRYGDRSFPIQSFATLQAAREYAKAQRRPWQVVGIHGEILDSD